MKIEAACYELKNVFIGLGEEPRIREEVCMRRYETCHSCDNHQQKETLKPN